MSKMPMSSATKSDDVEQQLELESMIQDLEEENMFLMEEYNRLQSELNSNSAAAALSGAQKFGSLNHKSSTLHMPHRSKYQRYINDTTDGGGGNSFANSRAMSSSPTSQLYTPLTPHHHHAAAALSSHSQHTTPHHTPHFAHHMQQQRTTLTNNGYQYYSSLNNAVPGISLNNSSAANRLATLFTPLNGSPTLGGLKSTNVAATNGSGAAAPLSGSTTALSKDNSSQIMNEARLLRQHEDRLEARMRILENHNRLLDAQLKQLKSLLNVNIYTI